MIDFLEAEELIIQQLKKQIAQVDGRVYSASDIVDIESRAKTPSAFVIFNGFNINQQRPDRQMAKLDQSWMVVIVGRNVRDSTGKGVRGQVGPILSEVMGSLLGWKPGDNLTEMSMENAPDPYYDEDGFGYFPLVFNTTLIIKNSE